MTNEELVQEIQNGRSDLMAQLWEQTKGFVASKAYRRFVLTDGKGGVEIADLVQSGYIALCEAVQRFRPDGEYSFLAYLNNTLKTAFSEAGGYRTERQKRDPLQSCQSLDVPCVPGDPDSESLADIIPDPDDQYEDADQKIWLEQLRNALDKALQDLPENQAGAVRSHYFEGRTLAEIASAAGVSIENVRQRERKALDKLRMRRHRYKLDQFAEQNRRWIDANTNFYAGVGPHRFNSTHTSAVEEIALRRERMATNLYFEDMRNERYSNNRYQRPRSSDNHIRPEGREPCQTDIV